MASSRARSAKSKTGVQSASPSSKLIPSTTYSHPSQLSFTSMSIECGRLLPEGEVAPPEAEEPKLSQNTAKLVSI